MLFVGQKSKNGNKTGIREIAEEIDSPEHFIAKILQELSRKHLIRSTKGPNGASTLPGRIWNAPRQTLLRQ